MVRPSLFSSRLSSSACTINNSGFIVGFMITTTSSLQQLAAAIVEISRPRFI
jgi:hypothetical protein